MRRADARCALALLALGGCMKIYPDPELPDLEVEWFADSCNGEDLALSLIGIDDPAFRSDVNVACSDGTYTFADVARQRYRVQGELRTADAVLSGRGVGELDLRNGLDQRASLFLSSVTNVYVRWTFAMDASCVSLGAESVALEFSSASLPAPLERVAPCLGTYYEAWLPDGVYTVVARALRGETPVAESPPSAPVTIRAETQTDVGTLVLTPCGESCDVPASRSGP